MIEIKRVDIHTLFDVHPFMYLLTDEKTQVQFYQKGSKDLAMIFRNGNSLEITEDDYLLYQATKDLYFGLTTGKLKNCPNLHSDFYNQYCINKLVKDKHVVWESDVMANEDEFGRRNEKLYNELHLIEKENSYILECVNRSNDPWTTIEFNTDRSKYESFVLHFMNYLHDLEYITEEYRQITMEEYLHSKQYTKK